MNPHKKNSHYAVMLDLEHGGHITIAIMNRQPNDEEMQKLLSLVGSSWILEQKILVGPNNDMPAWKVRADDIQVQERASMLHNILHDPNDQFQTWNSHITIKSKEIGDLQNGCIVCVEKIRVKELVSYP